MLSLTKLIAVTISDVLARLRPRVEPPFDQPRADPVVAHDGLVPTPPHAAPAVAGEVNGTNGSITTNEVVTATRARRRRTPKPADPLEQSGLFTRAPWARMLGAEAVVSSPDALTTTDTTGVSIMATDTVTLPPDGDDAEKAAFLKRHAELGEQAWLAMQKEKAAPKAPAPEPVKTDPIEALELKINKLQNLLAALSYCDGDRTEVDSLTTAIEVANDMLGDIAEDVSHLRGALSEEDEEEEE